jgi:hypothetical protein
MFTPESDNSFPCNQIYMFQFCRTSRGKHLYNVNIYNNLYI